jgi:hypothetical protein
MATCADEAPFDGGTVTVQVFCAGQLVDATTPLKVATICPSELKKLAPVMEMVSPAAPLDGVMESMTGGPPGVAARVDVVVLEAGPDGGPWWTG